MSATNLHGLTEAQRRYINDAQQRLMGLISVLSGHELEGLAPKQIADLQKCSPSLVTKDLVNLRAFGWAEEITGTGRWRLGPQIVQIAIKFQVGLDRAETRVRELSSRYARS